MALQIHGHQYSNSRLSKMFGIKDDAIKLKGWDRFCEWTGLFGAGQAKKQRLNSLYTELHAGVIQDKSGQQVENNNINRLIVFNNMSKIVNENNPNKISFSVHLNKPNGYSSDITFRVGNHDLLTKFCNDHEEGCIENLSKAKYFDNQGVLQSSLDEDIIQRHNPLNIKKNKYLQNINNITSNIEEIKNLITVAKSILDNDNKPVICKSKITKMIKIGASKHLDLLNKNKKSLEKKLLYNKNKYDSMSETVLNFV